LIKILKILDDSIKDNVTGQYSHARIIAMLIAFCASVFMWKLILLGGMSAEYFIAYLAYGTGHQTLNKFLDTRDSKRIPRRDYECQSDRDGWDDDNDNRYHPADEVRRYHDDSDIDMSIKVRKMVK